MSAILKPNSVDLSRFSALILDFDGVILDSETTQCAAWVHVLEKFGLDTSKVNPIYIIGEQDDEIVKQLVDSTKPDLRLEIQKEKTSYMQIEQETGRIKLVKGVSDFIKKTSKTHMLTIASNSHSKKIITTLRANNLHKYFTFIVAAEKKLPPKPNPAIYLEVLRSIGKPASECLVIEDSIHGIIAAKGAGLFTVAITTGLSEEVLKSYSDIVVNSFTQFNN